LPQGVSKILTDIVIGVNTFLKAFLVRFRFVRFLALARNHETLGQLGWLHVDFDDLLLSGEEPIPWFSYGAIDYLNQTISPNSSVLELGGGLLAIGWREEIPSPLLNPTKPGPRR